MIIKGPKLVKKPILGSYS